MWWFLRSGVRLLWCIYSVFWLDIVFTVGGIIFSIKSNLGKFWVYKRKVFGLKKLKFSLV